MRKTKLLDTLRALDTRERTWWRTYVRSDFFDKHPVLRTLADYLLAHAPHFDSEALDKRRVFATCSAKMLPTTSSKSTTTFPTYTNFCSAFWPTRCWKRNRWSSTLPPLRRCSSATSIHKRRAC